tara:strand:+ start:22263 stop:23255 length:993 start_codon:yes stop_codon:yes gene_type:complete
MPSTAERLLSPNKLFATGVFMLFSLCLFSQWTYNGLSIVAPSNEINSSHWSSALETNFNTACLMPYAYMRNGSDVIFDHERQYWGESDKGTREMVQQAKKLGLKVMLKPHLWIMPNTFTGTLTFEHSERWKTWAASYRKYIYHFAEIAEEEKVELFCLATEMESLWAEAPEEFEQLIEGVKKRYSGKLTYAANWDEYKRFPFWNQFDFIGVDAYFPLDKNHPTKSWNSIQLEMNAISDSLNVPIIFTEIGYRSIDDPFTKPWESYDNNTVNHTAQLKAYDAFFKTFIDDKHVAGAFIWKWFMGHFRKEGLSTTFSPQGKPAEKLLRKYYK